MVATERTFISVTVTQQSTPERLR